MGRVNNKDQDLLVSNHITFSNNTRAFKHMHGQSPELLTHNAGVTHSPGKTHYP